MLCTHNLLPNFSEYQNINLMTEEHSIWVYVLDAKYLRNIIAQDLNKLKLLWRYYGYHLVKLNPNDFEEVKTLTQKETKKLISELCEIEFYEDD